MIQTAGISSFRIHAFGLKAYALEGVQVSGYRIFFPDT
jgi:hypothetical protein